MFLYNFTPLAKILHSRRGWRKDKSHLWLMMQRKSVPRLSREGTAVTTSGLVLTTLPPISEYNKNKTLIKLGYSFVLAMIWSWFFFWIVSECWQPAEWEAIISVGNQQLFDGKFKVPQNENISPPIKALHALLCQYFFKQTENRNQYLVSSFWCQSLLYLMLFPTRHIPPKADRCCNQYSSLVIPSTFYYRPPLLPIIPPCCIRGRWHCQDLRKWNWGV